VKVLFDSSVIIAAFLPKHPSHAPCFVQLQAAELGQMAILNLPGGGIFDALIAQAAVKVSADRILTLNPSHFTRLNKAIAQIIEIPA